MPEVKWVKLTTDMFDNRKIKHLRRLPEGNNIVLIWVMLLTMAGRCNSGGMIFLTENIPYTPKMLADELDFEESTVLLALDALARLDMILTDNGVFTIAGWEEYQNADRLAELRAKDRERKRLKREQAKALLENSVNVHGSSTEVPSIEEEKEEDKEKEIHSFIRSNVSEENDFSSDDLKLKYLGGTLGQGVVLISDEQFHHLCEELSMDELDKYMGIIVECEKSGKRYKKKSHYQAILDMAAKDRRIHK